MIRENGCERTMESMHDTFEDLVSSFVWNLMFFEKLCFFQQIVKTLFGETSGVLPVVYVQSFHGS